jgi:diguanylate cyclase (GGDEF)-like protein
MGWVRSCYCWLADTGEVETPGGRALVAERFRALQRQIPLLYTVALTNFIGLHLATGGDLGALWRLPTLLIAFVLVRLVHWVRVRNVSPPPERILVELRRTWCYALIVSLGFGSWGMRLLDGGTAAQQDQVILFGSLAAIGCAYGLSSFPAAARLPLVFLGLPLAAKLVLSPESAHVGIGVSLSMVTLFVLRLLGVHNEGFAQLVGSRSQIAQERERARRAEKLAKTEKAKAKRIADTDPLTGLANRRAFLRTITRRAAALPRSGGTFALAMVDLDGFKPINDTFGHATGDAVLAQVGARLAEALAGSALVARTGGDEFALLIDGCDTRPAAEAAGAAICAALAEPVAVGGREFRISGCCGLALLHAKECDVSEALIRADTALYRAKEGGRSGVAVFTPRMDEFQRRRNQIEQALRAPGTVDTLQLVYQPIRDLSSGAIRAFEALARWEHPELGPVSPSEFIPIAEQMDAIGEITETLLAKTAVEVRQWPQTVRLSFNLSAVELCTAGSSARLIDLLGRVGIDPSRLQFEVTETALLADFEVARDNLGRLRAAGSRIVLDDFGAGNASISYLREMQFDGIKLDGSLIASSTESVRGRRLLKGVLNLCASLDLPCVAEHIETEKQLALLRELGCREGQGHLLSRPVDAETAAALAAPAVTSFPERAAA